ncbi:phosphatase PAP2 family protein [Streptomyces sp. DH24]|uniref:phosphatase PAP2 family protein n=1 Tax=Streptomyces sp. DH24 TaxID=3040123 RepID=UPI0024424931|nr:phosphatase PAP2 family protein [Streptomyces sp. DH24]MDG9720499.1 phosphatase PAP2 family protein [Streptomyces sp. DH24]
MPLWLPAVFFGLITWQVVADGPLLDADARVSRALVHPDRGSELLADLGNIEVALPVLLAVLGYVALRRRAAGAARWWLPPALAALLMAAVPLLVVPAKELTDRPGTPVHPGSGFFPSGHTATAAVAYGTAAVLLLPLLRTAHARRALVGACAVVNAGVGFGLVRRGYHWPLDVVASWCLGAVLLTLFVLLLRRSAPPSAPPEAPPEAPSGAPPEAPSGAPSGTPSGAAPQPK